MSFVLGITGVVFRSLPQVIGHEVPGCAKGCLSPESGLKGYTCDLAMDQDCALAFPVVEYS